VPPIAGSFAGLPAERMEVTVRVSPL
jgi:hypothetical protein